MKQDTEQLILDTARKHFMQKGYAATRMQEIADDAAINKAMLHYYFRSKELLYRKIIQQILGTVVPKFAGAMSIEGDFWFRLENFVDTYISTMLENPDIPIFIMSELSQKREDFIKEMKTHASHFPAIHSFFEQYSIEVKKGNLRAIPPMHLLMNIMGMTVFPFIAKPLISTVLNVSDEHFNSQMKERKQIIIDFIKHGISTK